MVSFLMIFKALLLLSSMIIQSHSYTWMVEYIYKTQTCKNTTTDQAIAILTGKCVKTSKLSSYIYSCSPSSGKTFYFNQTTYDDSPYCDGSVSKTTVTKINNGCKYSTKFACETDPEFEQWPGYGVWNKASSDDISSDISSCGQLVGPDHVVAFPSTCQTFTSTSGQIQSWKYTPYDFNGGVSSYLWYFLFSGTATCTAKVPPEPGSSATLVLSEQIGLFEGCNKFIEENTDSYRRVIQETVKTVPGVVILPYSSSAYMVSDKDSSLMMGKIISAVLGAFFILCLAVVAGWYYFWVYKPRVAATVMAANNRFVSPLSKDSDNVDSRFDAADF